MHDHDHSDEPNKQEGLGADCPVLLPLQCYLGASHAPMLIGRPAWNVAEVNILKMRTVAAGQEHANTCTTSQASLRPAKLPVKGEAERG
jgi:hypothetical protein